MNGRTTPGVRREWHDTSPLELLPGEYMYDVDHDGAVRVWIRLPPPGGDHGPCEVSGWSPVVHEDGTITLSPSILAHPTKLGPLNTITPGEPYTVPEWHGWLERGVWREC